MTAMNSMDSTTGNDAGKVTQRIKEYCDQAVVNLKSGRFKETYLFANEALELDEKDAKAAALYRYALYALYPKKRLLDKAKSLHEEADRCMKAGDHDKALELISLAKKWHCTPGILYARVRNFYFPRHWLAIFPRLYSSMHGGWTVREVFSPDLAYVDTTEGLAKCKEDMLTLATGQRDSLSLLGYKVLPEIEVDPVPRPDEMPARYHVHNWPTGLQINCLGVFLSDGYAGGSKSDGTILKPDIPLDQLAKFLGNHVQGAVQTLVFMGHPQDLVPRLLDEVPGRLHVDHLNFTDFFLLPWTSIERILNGRTLRVNAVEFFSLQLPSGVDSNELLKLPTVRECTHLRIWLYSRFKPQHPGLPPLFDNTALVEWIKRSGGRSLRLTRDYLSSGLLSFLDAFKKDFRQATQVHSYTVAIHCPNIDVITGLGVRNEELSNRLGEKMRITVGEDRAATGLMGHQFETVFVGRLPPS